MKRAVVTLVAALALASAAGAASPPPYRTDAQAEQYLASTRGVKPHGLGCINGYYAKRNKQSRKWHGVVWRVNGQRVNAFRHFACEVIRKDGRLERLYVQPRASGPWLVLPDR